MYHFGGKWDKYTNVCHKESTHSMSLSVIHERFEGKPQRHSPRGLPLTLKWIKGKRVKVVLYVACTTETLQIKLMNSCGKRKLQSK